MRKILDALIILLAGKRTIIMNAIITGGVLIKERGALIYKSSVRYTNVTN